MLVLFTKTLPDSDLLKIVTGALSAKFGDVVNFWIGSSSGSKAKDDIICENNSRDN